jgi:nucleotide-binding universal stress UspA family protein
MERILVAMDPVRTQLFAGNHALHLAKRISAKVHFLLIFPYSSTGERLEQNSDESAMKKKVDAVIDEARCEGIKVDYYITYGDYENELVSFVQENHITILVLEYPYPRSDAAGVYKDFLDKLRHRIDCRIEVVNVKSDPSERKE